VTIEGVGEGRFDRHCGQGQGWRQGKGCSWGRIVSRTERERENDTRPQSGECRWSW